MPTFKPDDTKNAVSAAADQLKIAGHEWQNISQAMIFYGLLMITDAMTKDQADAWVIPTLERTVADMQKILDAYNAAVRPERDN